MRRLVVAAVVAMAAVVGGTTADVVGTGPGTAPAAAAAAPAASPLLPPLPGWKPYLGPLFNRPGRSGSTAIVRRVLVAVRHAPRGSTIRIATYSFDRGDLGAALRKAHRRGVHVQLIVNRKTSSNLVWSLQRTLGKNPRRQSFVVTCPGRCRKAGDGGNQHIKIFSFTRTGGARDVIIGSSGNLTSKAVYRQWNDSWAIAYDPQVFNTWVGFFDQMKRQRRIGTRYVHAIQTKVPHPYSVSLQRTAAGSAPAAPAARILRDPVVQRLDKVGCRTVRGYGRGGRTTVRIMEYALFGGRGNSIARAIARVKRRGCDLMVIGSVFSPTAKRTMLRAGVPLRMADWRFAERVPEQEDGLYGWGPRFYAHYKAMVVDGTYGGQPTKSVWTGSENWSGISFANEEVVVRFTEPRYAVAYLQQFQRLWTGRATHRPMLEPTYGPPR